MYSDVMNKSLEANKRFVASMSHQQLLDFMAEFDNYEESEPVFTLAVKIDYDSYQDLIFYKSHKLFEEFMKPKRSVDIETNKKDPLNTGLFYYRLFLL